MIKYILQRDVDLRQLKQKRRNFSQLHLRLQQRQQSQQDPQSFTQVIANYKKNDEQSEELVRRLKVLRQQQRKMQGRAAQNDSKLEQYKSIREEIRQHRKRKQDYRQELAKQMQMTRSILAHERQTQSFRLQQARRKMYFQKWYNYLDQRENYRTEMNTTRQHFETELNVKRQKSSEIRQMEHQQRRKVNEFHKKRLNAIKLSNLQDKARVGGMNESKIEELQTLSHMQSILLSRQARSRMNSEQSQKMLNNITPYKNSPKLTKRSNKTLTPNDIYVL